VIFATVHALLSRPYGDGIRGSIRSTKDPSNSSFAIRDFARESVAVIVIEISIYVTLVL